ncbi:MAG: AAA family ATPase [Melioribacteraceae bacterium]|nr:AAA family ATPase [Melioribacteraceae bacterium]
MNINKILELHKQAIEKNRKYSQKRFIADKLLNDTGKHFVGLIGARGVGKSVLFKQISALTKDSIYISIDSIDIENLYELVKTLNEFYQYKVFFLDEIHFYISGNKINYLKTKKGKKTPNYLVDDNGTKYIIEVGGKGKGIQQFKGIDMKKSIIFSDGDRFDGIKRPLFLAGFLK